MTRGGDPADQALPVSGRQRHELLSDCLPAGARGGFLGCNEKTFASKVLRLQLRCDLFKKTAGFLEIGPEAAATPIPVQRDEPRACSGVPGFQRLPQQRQGLLPAARYPVAIEMEITQGDDGVLVTELLRLLQHCNALGTGPLPLEPLLRQSPAQGNHRIGPIRSNGLSVVLCRPPGILACQVARLIDRTQLHPGHGLALFRRLLEKRNCTQSVVLPRQPLGEHIAE